MADDKKAKEGTRDAIVKSQANYKGKSQADRIEVTILKDNDHGLKEGQVLKVHPTTAEIFKAKGLIK